MADISNTVTLVPCLAIEADARQVMTWRNDPVTLSVSFHQDPKVWERFWPEFRTEYFIGAPGLHPLFAVEGDERVAFVRYRAIEEEGVARGATVDISINIAPQARGRGLGKRVIEACLAYLSQQPVDRVYAEVLSHNVASLKLFVSTGFTQLEPTQKTVEDTGQTYRIDRFVYDFAAGTLRHHADVMPGEGRLSPGALLLDLDGTLADSLSVMRLVYQRFLQDFGIDGTDAEFASLNGPPLPRVVEILRETHALPGTTDTLLSQYMEVVDACYADVKPAKGARALLAGAVQRGWATGVVTSNSAVRTRAWLERAGLSDFIGFIVAGEDVVAGKPDPEPYRIAAARTGVPLSRIFAVEDSAQGARSAIAAGLRTFQLEDAHRERGQRGTEREPGTLPAGSLEDVATTLWGIGVKA